MVLYVVSLNYRSFSQHYVMWWFHNLYMEPGMMDQTLYQLTFSQHYVMLWFHNLYMVSGLIDWTLHYLCGFTITRSVPTILNMWWWHFAKCKWLLVNMTVKLGLWTNGWLNDYTPSKSPGEHCAASCHYNNYVSDIAAMHTFRWWASNCS